MELTARPWDNCQGLRRDAYDGASRNCQESGEKVRKREMTFSGPIRWVLAGLLATLLVPAPGGLRAQAPDYPVRPVTIVVPYAVGGGTDILGRMVAQRLEQQLGRSFIIENLAGAGGTTGAAFVARANPDGYTLLMAPSPTLAVAVSIYKSLAYDPLADFVPLALIAQTPFVLVVNPSLPVHSIAELIALAKAEPGRLAFGSAGPGTPHHLYAELFKSMTGIEMSHIPYRGSLPLLTDVVAGHIPLTFIDFGPSVGMLQAGKVRPLGISTKTRLAQFPDVATVSESGLPGFFFNSWFAILAPAGTPKLGDTEVRRKLEELGFAVRGSSAEELRAMTRDQLAKYARVIKEMGIAGE